MTDTHEFPSSLSNFFERLNFEDEPLLAYIGLVYMDHIHDNLSAEDATFQIERLLARHPNYQEQLTMKMNELGGQTPLMLLRSLIETTTNIYQTRVELQILAGFKTPSETSKRARHQRKMDNKEVLPSSTDAQPDEKKDESVTTTVARKNSLKAKQFRLPLTESKRTFVTDKLIEPTCPRCSEPAQEILTRIYTRFLEVSRGLGTEGLLPEYYIKLFNTLVEKTVLIQPRHLENKDQVRNFQIHLTRFLQEVVNEKAITRFISSKGRVQREREVFFANLIQQYAILLTSKFKDQKN